MEIEEEDSDKKIQDIIDNFKKSDKNYLRFDEKSNAYDSLEKLLFFFNNIGNDLNFWKWGAKKPSEH